MDNILSATPIGCNIKTKDNLFFAGHKIMAPLPKTILQDLKARPHLWKVEVAEEVESENPKPVTAPPAPLDVKTSDVEVPAELQLSPTPEKPKAPAKSRTRRKMKGK